MRGAPGQRLVHQHVAVDARGATGAHERDVGGGQAADQRGAGHVAARRCNREVGGVNQPKPALARQGRGGHARGVSNLHLRGRGFYKTPVAARGRRGIKRAAQGQRAHRHVAHQANRALVVLQGLRLHQAAAVNSAAAARAVTHRGEQHLAAVGRNQAGVLRRGVGGAAQHAQVDKAALIQVQANGLCAGQRGGAQGGGNASRIGHARANQRDKAAAGRADQALV